MPVDFKALLAQKKAEKEALAAGVTIGAPVPVNVQAPVEEHAVTNSVAVASFEKTIPEPVKEAPVISTEPAKKLTFAEIMAAKNAAKQATPAPTASPNVVAPTQLSQTVAAQESTGTVPSLTAPAVPETAGVEAPGTDIVDPASIKGTIEEALENEAANADPATEQAYSDIKGKIEQLEAMEDTSLSGAMTELKKALMANPNAVSLMHDTDIGKMVIALRRITKEAQVEGAKEKATAKGKKGKVQTLDPTQLAAVWDEL